MKTKVTLTCLTITLLTLLTLLSLLFTTSCSISSKGSVTPVNLTVEYLTNPFGLDIEMPRLSWTLEATKESEFGQKQTAYRILVSSSERILKGDKGDIWDTGWV